jgi:quinoprotein dehydrogenase-associated probable ABC transporter substrate-binding protein
MYLVFSLLLLRVCADPNNLPYSNAKGQGFENRIAALVAQDLGRTLTYEWRPQRRGFVRETLKANRCDLMMSVPANYEMAWPTRPYYRSTYVFVTRRGTGPGLASLDDPTLRRLRIGIQVTGNDYNNPPAAHALAERRLSANVRGFTVYGDYSQPEPQRPIIDAVARGDVDTAIVWGPLAGFYARRNSTLTISRVEPSPSFVFDIAMGTRRGDRALHDAVNGVIARDGGKIRQILREFGVPLV